MTSCQVLEAFHHPYFNTGRSNIQNEMFRALERWVNDLEDREQILEALTKVDRILGFVSHAANALTPGERTIGEE